VPIPRSRSGPAALAALAVLALAAAAGAALLRAFPDLAGWAPAAGITGSARPPDAWEVCFTPPGDCTALLVREIRRARRSILVQAYGFTSAPIAQALAEAQRRGVAVRAILDRSTVGERYSVATYLSRAGIPVLLDDPPGLAHNKVMVMDGETVVTGSFNFTRAAEDRNAENLLVLRDPRLAAAYAANWERRRAGSRPYEPALRAPGREEVPGGRSGQRRG